MEHALETVPCAAVLVPTRTGTTARMISRFKPSVWIVAVSHDPAVCQGLAFSYGVYPVELADDPDDWREFTRSWLREHRMPGRVAMLVAGPSVAQPRRQPSHRVHAGGQIMLELPVTTSSLTGGSDHVRVQRIGVV